MPLLRNYISTCPNASRREVSFPVGWSIPPGHARPGVQARHSNTGRNQGKGWMGRFCASPYSRNPKPKGLVTTPASDSLPSITLLPEPLCSPLPLKAA